MDEKEKLPTGGKRVKKSGKALLIAALCVVGALVIGFGAACFAASRSSEILRGTSVFAMDFGGMTAAQAAQTLEQDVVRSGNGHAEFRMSDGREVSKSYAELGLDLDCEQTAQRLCAYGRDGGVLQNGWQYMLSILGGKKQVEPVWNIDAAQLRKAAREIGDTLNDAPVNFSYTADETGLRAVKPRDGQKFTADGVIKACEERICSGGELVYYLEPDVPVIAPEKGDYAAYLAELQRQTSEPCANASYDKESENILPERTHISFDLDAAVAKMNAAEGGASVLITTEVECPAVTAEVLEQVLFRDVIGTYTTKVGGAPGRHKNVQLTASRIDGYVMNSGESIKYAELTTPFTLENGYFLAPMYFQGKTVDGAGGGACQASSTLYAASLLANLEIVQRVNHGFASDYIGLGLDATVAEGGPEFEVRNNTDYPIRVQAIFETKNGKDYITVNLLGTKTDDTYVRIRTEVLSTTPYEEEIVETEELAPGVQEVEQTPYTGYLVKTYRQIYSGDGKLISETFEATSKYNARNRIIRVGKGTVPASGEQPIEQPVEQPIEQPETQEPVVEQPPVPEMPVEEMEIPGWLIN